MHLKLIACNIFEREACHCVARSPHVIDIEFTELGEHVHPEKLRETLQAAIDAADASGRYEAILLLFGLCGNAGVGLQARTIPLVMPRAHDCCTILLGSRERFKELLGEAPSTPFSSSGYMERGYYFLRIEDGESKVHYGDAYAEYVEKYGEDNAKFIWEQMHPEGYADDKRAIFIDLPEFAFLSYDERFREKAEAEGREYVKVEGSMRLIEGLISGEWSEDEYLIVRPGQKTQGVYDWVEIIRAK
ncbi:MAG: DUF1638 domain-containing protein [Armatimonadota bacterium]